MVPNDSLINALRELGYSYKTQTDRMLVYKKMENNETDTEIAGRTG